MRVLSISLIGFSSIWIRLLLVAGDSCELVGTACRARSLLDQELLLAPARARLVAWSYLESRELINDLVYFSQHFALVVEHLHNVGLHDVVAFDLDHEERFSE